MKSQVRAIVGRDSSITPKNSVDLSASLQRSRSDKIFQSSPKAGEQPMDTKTIHKEKKVRNSLKQLDLLSPIPVGKQLQLKPDDNATKSSDAVAHPKYAIDSVLKSDDVSINSIQRQMDSLQMKGDQPRILSLNTNRNYEAAESLRVVVSEARERADQALQHEQTFKNTDANHVLGHVDIRTSRSATNPAPITQTFNSPQKQYPHSASGFKASVSSNMAATSLIQSDSNFCEKHKLEKCVLCQLFNPKPVTTLQSIPKANTETVIVNNKCEPHELKDCLLCSLRSNQAQPFEMPVRNASVRDYSTKNQPRVIESRLEVSDDEYIRKSSGIDSMAFFDKAKQQLEDTLNRGEERRAAGVAAANISSPRISKAHSPLVKLHSSFEKPYYSDRHSYRRYLVLLYILKIK